MKTISDESSGTVPVEDRLSEASLVDLFVGSHLELDSPLHLLELLFHVHDDLHVALVLALRLSGARLQLRAAVLGLDVLVVLQQLLVVLVELVVQRRTDFEDRVADVRDASHVQLSLDGLDVLLLFRRDERDVGVPLRKAAILKLYPIALTSPSPLFGACDLAYSKGS